MSATNFGRKRIYLPGTFQGKLACRASLYWILYHMAMWHSLFMLDYVISQTVDAVSGPRHSFGELYLSFAQQNWTLALWAIAIGPVFVWEFVRISHRIAGPIRRLEGTLLRMAKGETIESLKFRKDDYLKSLEKAFNAYLQSLSKPEVAGPQTHPDATTQPLKLTAVQSDLVEKICAWPPAFESCSAKQLATSEIDVLSSGVASA